ncbi:putative Chordin-like protein 1 [Hypsibius exemplaris]|uniref:Chordin-like protein 1 n=1 Tax=Hypsibius exemplaris TaxID=2072580 RepID=A0A1W0WLT1_HYPEX|nr:putative Chordin-like protein 1 [Hypsibius exemplaris]
MALTTINAVVVGFCILASLFPQVWALPVNPSCEFHNAHGKQIYPVGDSWEVRVGSQKDFQCMNCTCLTSSLSVQCLPLAAKKCPDLDDCLKIVDVAGSCCPVCEEVVNQVDKKSSHVESTLATDDTGAGPEGCIHNGLIYREGERWAPGSNTTAVRPNHDDQCVQCECQGGYTICYLKMCPTFACRGMVIATQDNCCPVCEEFLPTVFNSQSLPVSDASADEISNGVTEDDFDPYTELADEEKQECISGPEKYEHGATWHPVIPPFGRMKCVLCECDSGQIRCKRPACPENLPCSRPVTKPGQCCPVCDESNEIVNVSTGTFLCVRNGDYLVYENLHGGTVEILLRLPEEDMLWKHTWKMGTNSAEVLSTKEMKLREFKRLHSADHYRLLGVSKPRKVQRFSRRMNKIRHTCHQRCSKRVERLVQVLQIQAAQSGRKAECPDRSRPVNTAL